MIQFYPHSKFLYIFICLTTINLYNSYGQNGRGVTQLKCEYLINPIGIDAPGATLYLATQ